MMENVTKSYFNYTDLFAESETIATISAAFMLLYFIIGVPWNALVIGVIVKKKLFTQPPLLLMLNLAIANFLTSALLMPYVVLGFTGLPAEEDFATVDMACQASIVLTMLILAIIYTVALLSVDRLIYLKRPLVYTQIVTPKRMFIAIVLMWIYCFSLAILPLLGFGRVGYNPYVATCGIVSVGIQDIIYLILCQVCGAFGTVVQVCCSGVIVYSVRREVASKLRRLIIFKDIPEGRQEGEITKEYKRTQLQLVKVFGAILTASLLTSLPSFIHVVASIVNPYSAAIAIISLLAKSILHPILELYMIHEIREVFTRLLNTRRVQVAPAGENNAVGEAPGLRIVRSIISQETLSSSSRHILPPLQ
jgi:hypothetical protein